MWTRSNNIFIIKTTFKLYVNLTFFIVLIFHVLSNPWKKAKLLSNKRKIDYFMQWRQEFELLPAQSSRTWHRWAPWPRRGRGTRLGSWRIQPPRLLQKSREINDPEPWPQSPNPGPPAKSIDIYFGRRQFSVGILFFVLFLNIYFCLSRGSKNLEYLMVSEIACLKLHAWNCMSESFFNHAWLKE